MLTPAVPFTSAIPAQPDRHYVDRARAGLTASPASPAELTSATSCAGGMQSFVTYLSSVMNARLQLQRPRRSRCQQMDRLSPLQLSQVRNPRQDTTQMGTGQLQVGSVIMLG